MAADVRCHIVICGNYVGCTSFCRVDPDDIDFVESNFVAQASNVDITEFEPKYQQLCAPGALEYGRAADNRGGRRPDIDPSRS